MASGQPGLDVLGTGPQEAKGSPEDRAHGGSGKGSPLPSDSHRADAILHKIAQHELVEEIAVKHVSQPPKPPGRPGDLACRLLALNFRKAQRQINGFFNRSP